MKLWDKAVLLPLDSLVFCDWNANELDDAGMAALIEDIQSGGFDEPAQVVPIDDGKYLVLGGEHRTKALRALDQDEVPCVVRNDLSGKTRKDLIIWSVRRNNIRGKVNEQKYAKLEQELVNQHNMTADAARQSMLIHGELAKALKKSDKRQVSDNDLDEPFETDGKRDEHNQIKERESLLSALRTAEQEVLLQSGDTVEHGYLFFAQADKLHLVINESKSLFGLVRRMVEACKGESAKVDDFLISALTKELPAWE